MFRTLLISICLICSATSAQTPIFNEDFKLLASDGASGDHFGWSVSISGDSSTAIVGASNSDDNGDASGSAYIYRFDGNEWTEETKLTASDGASGQLFCRTVAISSDGSTAIVGAERDDGNGLEAGSAYIYRFDGNQWIEEAKLLASDGESNDHFGASVSISGDTAIVGANYDDDNGSGSGSAYIYGFDGSEWVEETKLLASDGASGDSFGISVSISGDGSTALIGSWFSDDNAGSAYIYSLVKGIWQETKLLDSDGAAGDLFGMRVSISSDGSTAIVGVDGDDDNGYSSGSAYIYGFDGSEWVEETKLLASDGASDDRFGRNVSISNDGSTVIVVASGTDTAYIYRFVGKQWIEKSKLTASDGASNDRFGDGISISSNGSTVIIGAHEDDDNGSDSGSAYSFEIGVDSDGDGIVDDIDNCYLYNPDQTDCNDNGIGDVCDIADTWSGDCNSNLIPDECDIADGTSQDCNGNGIPDVCDVADSTSWDCDQNNVPDECQPDCDGDGWPDACENEADCDDDGIPDSCEADCNTNGIADDCDIMFELSQDCNENGIPDECDIVDGVLPDCNGNGISDYCGIEDGTELDCDGNGVPDDCDVAKQFQEETKLLASDGDNSDYFGDSVSISGDTAIVGAYKDNNGNGPDAGAAYIYRFDGSEWIEEAKLLPSDGNIYDEFGNSVSIDDDTVVIGSHQDDDQASGSGSAYIYRFNGDQWIEEAKLLASDGDYNHYFGTSVSIDGDTVIVGACQHNSINGSDAGAAYIYRFDGSEWIEESKLLPSDGASDDLFGCSVSIDGDTVVVGAYQDDEGSNTNSGSAYIFRFNGKQWLEEAKFLAADGADGDKFGYSVSIDGDNVVVGAPKLYDLDHGGWVGSAYIFHFDGSDWQQDQQFFGLEVHQDSFGHSVSISGDTVVVGSHLDTGLGASGSAYIYRFGGFLWIRGDEIYPTDGENGLYFGFSVSVDSDTVIVGTPNSTNNGANSGSAYIFVPGVSGSDCDENGIPDDCDVEDPANDQNQNGIVDQCECLGDTDLDGDVDTNDILNIIGFWGNDTPSADLNFDGTVNVEDLLILIAAWGPCE